MKKTVFLASSLLMMFLSWTSIAHAQNMGEMAGSEEVARRIPLRS